MEHYQACPNTQVKGEGCSPKPTKQQNRIWEWITACEREAKETKAGRLLVWHTQGLCDVCPSQMWISIRRPSSHLTSLPCQVPSQGSAVQATNNKGLGWVSVKIVSFYYLILVSQLKFFGLAFVLMCISSWPRLWDGPSASWVLRL